MIEIYSPLVHKGKVRKIKDIEVATLVKKYQDRFGISTERFFRDLDRISIYQCTETGYSFYYPFNLDGDSFFYEELQRWKHYYEPWKWEHQVALDRLKGDEKILEIGSGTGGFLGTLSERKFDITGLELNEKAVKESRANGWKVSNQTVQNHALEYPEKYDVVCSFQVVEHIAAVKSFIQASLDCLKPGGKMIISVPNNDSIKMKLLNLGCGTHFHNDWTNLDFVSTGENVIAHDLLKGIPFKNKSFDVVYHSHVLEHFRKEDGAAFMKECYRVLKPGGIIRVVLPNLETIVKNYIQFLDAALLGNKRAEHNYD